ncbi:2'-5' RNA ligase [Pullulanibacillus pueri]|uniref:RNA 2',3'-cyclic phosphodiesterase n=1 Tax=Pullulanibacillus pueri TaxID=1437324 RepID=A0A8J3ENW0_9BACL|nr:RNA 2',3'-cyclic phosphodiesterase [Pullulanibacillus pueri]MBM7683820.1 2'-5' RNA ligase [Pullulanibacillus pueri]GGH87778.1 RNA 2',3'-cyclic phosphodiesterase [Pullulanibacillus pueri]
MNQPSHYFLAVPLPEEIKSFLFQCSQQLKKQASYKVWMGKHDFHITLVFLGGVAKEKLVALIDRLNNMTFQLEAMNLKLKGLGGFGKKDQPRVLFADVEQSDALAMNQKRVAQCCRECGFQVERRPYRPHITLGKKWAGEGPLFLERLAERIPPLEKSWSVKHIVLYEIHPGADPKYMPVQKFYCEP